MRRLLTILALAFLASACADDAGPEEMDAGAATSSSTSPSAGSSTTTPSGPEANTGEWETVHPTFEVDGFSESVEGNNAGINTIGTAAGAYWAAGGLNGHPTIWRSEDLTDFEVVYHHDWTPWPRWTNFTTIVEFDGQVLIGGTGRVRNAGLGEDLERSFLLSTADDGATWLDHEHDWLTGEFQRLDRLVPVGDALLVDLVNDECCERPQWMPLRTADLTTWEPVVLPETDADTWGSFLSDHAGTVWAIARHWEDDGPVLNLWESIEAGSSWSQQEPGNLNFNGYAAVDGSIFFPPDADRGGFGPTHSEVSGPWGFTDGVWSELPHDIGQWGDGRASVSGTVNADGRFYGMTTRTTRASAHYCYDDLETCQIPVFSLVTTLDGVDWLDIVGPEVGLYESPTLLLTLDGRPLLWRNIRDRDEGDERRRTFTVWTGSEPPPTQDPAGYAPPDIPVPVIDSVGVLDVGDERRYGWGLGGCGGMYIDGIDWLPVEEPDTTGWPILPFNGSDGPTGWALGRVLRVADDHIQFWIEGDDVRHDFRPRVGEAEYVCG